MKAINEGNFKCIVCGNPGGYQVTGKHPRDRIENDIVVCNKCKHIQMYPLLSKEEEKEEYDNDVSVREMLGGTGDLSAMRVKFSEWTKTHVDMYWDKMQKHEKILNLGSGYGFFEEECNKRSNKCFEIEGVEIGKYRLDNYVGGMVHNIDFYDEKIPNEMLGKYDLILSMHLLEHLTEPVEYLKKIKPLLTDGGELIFEVPNTKCFLAEISRAYADFIYLYEHVSYYTHNSLRNVFELAGYNVRRVYSREIYSIENHLRWCREGMPFTKYNQMYVPEELEFINKIYKEKINEMDKGYSLIIEAEK